MNTRDDITDGEQIDITILVTEIDPWDHDAVDKKVILKDIEDNRIPLTIFKNNDCAEFEWETDRWYRLKNATGNYYAKKDEMQLKPSWSFGIVPLDDPPEDAVDTGVETHSGATDKTNPDDGFQKASDVPQTGQTTADGGAVLTQDMLSPGNYLLHFPISKPLSELKVHEYQLNVSGGFDPNGDGSDDVLAFTSRAAARYRYRSDGPVTSNGPMKLYAINKLHDTLDIDDHTVEPEHLGRTTLKARHFDHRQDLIDLVKQDIKAALRGTYNVTAINSIIEFTPHIKANSGDFTASREYGIRVWVDPDGTVVCGISVGFHLQSTFTAEEYRARGYDLDGVTVEHDTDVYDRPATGRVIGLSDTKYTEPLAEMGNSSIADYHRDRGYVEPDLIDSVAAGDPQLTEIDYGNGSPGLQVLKFLRVVPTLDQLKLVDKDFHERFQRTARMLPDERYSIATSFVKSIDQLPTLGLEISSTPTNDCYDELAINTRKANLRFANGKTASYGAAGLRNHGVHQAPDPFDVLAIYPHNKERESQEFIRQLLKTLNNYGATPTQIDQESYKLGSEFAYTQVASDATSYDGVVAVVPDPMRLPTDVDDPYPEFKRQFGQSKIPSQMVTTPNLGENAYLGNIVAGLVGGCGGVPWRIHEVPGEADVFVGLDVTYDHSTGQHLGASANVVYADGTILASQSHSLQAGETFDIEDIVTVIKNLLRVYVQEENRTPRNIVIHRDGQFYCDVDELIARFEDASGFDTKLDLVEIRKSGNPRIAEYTGEKFEVANKGLGFVARNADHAYLATTGKPELKPGNPIGTPRPIRVVKRHGNSDLKTLTEQAYWLSEAHVGSISRSTRLPITTYYADRCAEHARKGYLLNGELIRGVPYL